MEVLTDILSGGRILRVDGTESLSVNSNSPDECLHIRVVASTEWG